MQSFVMKQMTDIESMRGDNAVKIKTESGHF